MNIRWRGRTCKTNRNEQGGERGGQKLDVLSEPYFLNDPYSFLVKLKVTFKKVSHDITLGRIMN